MASNLTDKERADLVAFLDGELDAESSQALEAKLARDPGARAELDQLRRTWELLDFLPKPEPTPSFTHRTLERIGPVRTGAQPKRTTSRLPRWAFAAGWAASVALAVGAGYLGLTLWLGSGSGRREPTEQDLVRDLRVIENKRFYELVDDVEFLKDLDHPDLFGEEPHGS